MAGKLPIPLTRKKLENEALSDEAFRRNSDLVRAGFWPKFWKVLGHVPFSDELLSSWYALTDPATPRYVKGLLAAALAYFVMPVDLVPDLIMGLGFMDDAAVLAAVVKLVDRHITQAHREAAQKRLSEGEPDRKNFD